MAASPSSKSLITNPGRSRLMRRVGRENTAPELAVRRYLHAYGLRFRLHVSDLPGTPDLVLPSRRTVVFVHGCFWHGHDCSHGTVRARTNAAYWDAKIHDNRSRDLRKEQALRELGWFVETIWECECNDTTSLRNLRNRLVRR
jgi:DNA mismatch endonuclease (patch repair protein)